MYIFHIQVLFWSPILHMVDRNQFHFSLYGSQCSQCHLLTCMLSYLSVEPSSSYIKLLNCLLCSIVLLSACISISHCFYHCEAFWYVLVSDRTEAATFLIFLKIKLTIHGPLVFHMNFVVNLTMNFIEISLNV